MKDHLIFDTTNATTISDTDSVGAYLRASDGTLLTHTDVGGKKALDVRLAEGVNVEVDLSHTDDSVRLGDGTAFFTSTSENSDIALDVHISNTQIAVTQGSDSPWAVEATNLDIRDLTHVSDSVKLGDGTALFTSTLVGSKQSLDVYIANDPATGNTSLVATAETGSGTAGTSKNAVASPLADRRRLWIYNNDNQKMFIGGTGVTTAAGFPVSPGSYLELAAGAAVDVEFVSAKASHLIRTLELS